MNIITIIYIVAGLLAVGIVTAYFKREKLQEMTERNAIKIEAKGEIVLLKHSAGIFKVFPLIGSWMKEWHQFYPIINEDGSWNLVNALFGGRKNFVKLLTVLILVAMAFFGFYQITHGLQAQINVVCNHFDLATSGNVTVDAICGHNVSGLVNGIGAAGPVNITGLNVSG